MSDSSFDRKCPGEKTFTIVDIDYFSKINIDRSIYLFSVDRYIDFRSINISIFDNLSSLGMLLFVVVGLLSNITITQRNDAAKNMQST